MEELFKKYALAWDSFNAESIASLYRLPCAISDSDGVQTYSEKSALIEKFENNCEQMRGIGYRKASFNILNQMELNPGQVAVNVGWLIETKTQNIEFRTLYICHQIDHAWYVFSANVYQGSFRDVT